MLKAAFNIYTMWSKKNFLLKFKVVVFGLNFTLSFPAKPTHVD